ncbi:hypothetical protein V1511DRAFT_510302 [Dipodascopsis uninucleata]
METLDSLFNIDDASLTANFVKRLSDLKMTSRKEGRWFLREVKELYQFLEKLSGTEMFLRLMLRKLQAPE